MSYGKDLMAMINALPDPSREYSLRDDPSRIPDDYLSALAMKSLGEKFFSDSNYDIPSDYTYRKYSLPETISPAIYRDALRGAQMAADNDWLTTTRDAFPQAVATRLRAIQSPLVNYPHNMYSPTGEDYYRLLNPDAYVAPYANTYNEEQMPDLVVPEYQNR